MKQFNTNQHKNTTKLGLLVLVSTLPTALIYVVFPFLMSVLSEASDVAGTALFKGLLLYGIIFLALVATAIVLDSIYGHIYGFLVIFSTIFTFLAGSQSVGSTNYWVGLLLTVAVMFFVNLLIENIWQKNTLHIGLRLILIIFLAVGVYYGVRLSSNEIKQNQVTQKIEAKIYLPDSTSPLTYQSYDYFEAEAIPYFSLKFKEGLRLDIYKRTYSFNPPQNCGYNPAHLPQTKPCTKVGTTSSGITVWRYTETNNSYAIVEYYANLGSSIIHFNKGATQITDKQALQLVESLQPVSIDEL